MKKCLHSSNTSFLIIIFLVVILFISCNKEPSLLDIPYISYTVNGEEIHSEENFFSSGTLYYDYLVCYHWGANMQFTINQPAVGTFYTNSHTYNNLLIAYNDETYASHIDSTNASYVTITEFDEINGKASGTFYFEGRNIEDTSKKLIVTDGVFNDFYFNTVEVPNDEQNGQMHYKINGKEYFLYHVYNGANNSDNLSIYSYNILEEGITISGIPNETGMSELITDSLPNFHYHSTTEYYINIIDYSFVNVINKNLRERYAELNFEAHVVNALGDTLHITDGYVKVYY